MFAANLEEQPQQAQEPEYACDPLLWPHLTADERQRGVARFWELSQARQAALAAELKRKDRKA